MVLYNSNRDVVGGRFPHSSYIITQFYCNHNKPHCVRELKATSNLLERAHRKNTRKSDNYFDTETDDSFCSFSGHKEV